MQETRYIKYQGRKKVSKVSVDLLFVLSCELWRSEDVMYDEDEPWYVLFIIYICYVV